MVVNEVPGDIQITLGEVHEYGEIHEPELVMKLSSVEIYPCSNYILVTQESQKGGVLTVKIIGENIGSICLTALGHATTEIALDESVEKLLLIKNGEMDQYDVTINDELAKFEVIESHFSLLDYNTYNRYPENSFACVCGTSNDYPQICEDFYEAFEVAFPAVEEIYLTDGHSPYPDSSSGHWIDYPTRIYRYQSEEQYSQMGQFLYDFADDHINPQTGVSINLVNWKNQWYKSGYRPN